MDHLLTIWRDPTLRLISVASLLFGAFAASFAPYLSLIGITVFNLSDNAYALQLVASLIVSVAAAVGIGIVTDQYRVRKPLALIAAASIVLSMAIVWIGGTTTAFVFAHVLILPVAGTIFGQIFAITRLYTTGLPDETRDGITAAVRALFAVPFIIVLPLWGAAFDAGLPVLSLYPVMLGLGVVFFWLVLRHWPADKNAPWAEQKSSLGFVASLRELAAASILWRIVCMGAIHSGSTLMGILLALVFIEANGRGPDDVGLFFGGFVAFEIVVMLGVGRLLGIARRLHIIAAGAGFYAVFLALLPVLAPFPTIWLLIVPAAIGGGLLYGLSISYLQDLLGERAGAGASLVALQRLVSEGLAAVIFAFGAWLGGYHIAAFIGAATIIAGTLMLLWIDRQQRQ